MAKLNRITAKTKLGSGYLDPAELVRMTGRPKGFFGAVVLKELLDNALDACETAGVAPEIAVNTHRGLDRILIGVADNAGGIPPEVVDGILDFNIRISDKSAYRAPTRGQMGNAWKTIVGIPHALGSKEPITITARGIQHKLRAWLDPAGDVAVSHEQKQVPVHGPAGTVVLVPLLDLGQTFEPELWVRSAAVYNPHLSIQLKNHGDRTDEIFEMYKPTVSGAPEKFKKLKPKDPTSPHWYDVASLEKLIFVYVKDAEEGRSPDLPIGKFIRQFAGLARTEKAKHVAGSVYWVRRLSEIAEMDEPIRRSVIRRLLEAMQQATDPPTHKALGKLGREHLRRRFDEMYGIVDDRFWYQSTEGYQGGMPYRFEVAVAEVGEPAQLFGGVNYSPTFGDPLAGMRLHTEGARAFGVEGLLDKLHATPWESIWEGYDPDDEQPHTAVAIHFISPVVSYQDLGKSTINTRSLRSAPGKKSIETALWDATKKIYKEEERRRKKAARPSRPADRSPKESEDEPDLKAASFSVMNEAVEHVSGGGTLPYGARRLFYRVRDMISSITSKRFHPERGYQYFSQTILTEYQRDHGKLEGLYYDPRGKLHEPHTGKTLDIGTREVEAYSFPTYVYDKILFVEKKGQMPLLEAANIAEKYDMAILTGEGFATEAARTLLESASKDEDYQLFVLHDADPSGYSIARTVREETKRMPGYSVEVIDLGLKIEEVVALEGVHPEEFVSKKALEPALLDALPEGSLAREYFVGEEFKITEDGKEKKAWRRKRIELDNLTAPQLIAYLESSLEANGVRGKVIPPEDYLRDAARSKYVDEVHAETRRIIDGLVQTERIQKIVARVLRERYNLNDARQWIEEGFKEDATLSWTDPLKSTLAKRSVDLRAELGEVVERALKKLLEE